MRKLAVPDSWDFFFFCLGGLAKDKEKVQPAWETQVGVSSR